jgi:putative selenate reductase
MSDRFTPCSIDKLLRWILEEEKQGEIFGIRKDLFFIPQPSDAFKMKRYGQDLETPIGVAAGPHTQLSQNIISAWLTGARYMELKTVQTLDELEVTKPCIDMTDEGYNCEWSQELKLEQSFNEYLNAWIILHILKDRFGWGRTGSPGFIFNMSVGYNLDGILNSNVQAFLR